MPIAFAPRPHVVVDMTPLEGRGQNGGAGLVATTLVRHLGALAADLDFTLLTAEASHAELAPLDAHNVRRTCVVGAHASPSVARRVANRLLPPRARAGLQHAYWTLRTSRGYGRATEELRADLLFCPFTVPYFWRRGVACVCVVHDLQHLTYPEFFTSDQRLNRQQHLADACRNADRVVCVSNYVRVTVLTNAAISPNRVVTVPHGLLHTGGSPDYAVLDRLALRGGEFLLYPANFWPHKNHRRLFEALRIFREGHPDTRLSLVCTGAPNALVPGLKSAADALLPDGTVVFAGYVPAEQLVALLDASKAVIFPSLYEGFGMPVLEAMAWGKPVLCSNVTSLPEVADEGATYFDPTDPQQIASAIETLYGEPALIARRATLGRHRAAAFGDAGDMAMRYLALFRQLLPAGAGV